jgi:RNA polymerase sigma factor (sigma-70 family)
MVIGELTTSVPRRSAPAARQPSDEELLAAFYRGEDRALDRLMARYDWLEQLIMSRLPYGGGARAQQAEDLVQVTWVKVMDSRSRTTSRWRGECGPVRPWLLRIASNCIVDAGRKDSVPLCRREPAEDADPVQENLFVVCELRAALAAGLEALEQMESVVVVLKFWAGMQQNEIADALAVSEATISRTWNSARRKLRATLTAAGWNDDR